MKEKLTNNLAIKLIALFCAFFVWLAVVNVANPIKVSTREVPVTITNDQVLEQADLAYDVVGKKTAVISFKIRTKDDYKVKASDFNAYADLSEMYDVTGAIPIRVEVVNNEELLESTAGCEVPGGHQDHDRGAADQGIYAESVSAGRGGRRLRGR